VGERLLLSSDDNKLTDEVVKATGDADSRGEAPGRGFRSQPKLWDDPASSSRSDLAPASADAPSSFALRSFSGPLPGPTTLEPVEDQSMMSASPQGADTIRSAEDDLELELEGDDKAELVTEGGRPPSEGAGGDGDDGDDGGGPPQGEGGEARRDPLAVASLVLGVLAYPCCCVCSLNFPVALVSVVLGAVSLVRIKNHPERWSGQGMAIGGIGASVMNVLFWVFWLIAAGVIGGLMGGFGGLWLTAPFEGISLPSIPSG